MQLEDYLPSVARLRAKGHRVRVGGALGLFGGRDFVTADGVSREEVAAVLISCRGIVRTRKETEREIGPHRAAQMFRGEPPPPGVEELRHIEVLLGMKEPSACTECAMTSVGAVQPGVRTCGECSGTGRVAASGDAALVGGVGGLVVSAVIEAVGSVCPSCHGRKVVACSTCDGTGMSVRALVGAVRDAPVAFSHVYIPSLSVALESKLEEALASVEAPPECLRIDPATAGAAFGGFAFGDRLERAKGAIDRTVGDGQLLGGWLHCFAWPLLVMKSNDAEAVVYADASGKLRTLQP